MGVLKNYRMLLEGSITPSELNEVTKFQKYALYNSTEAKDVSRYIKEARRETDDKKKKALYKKALDTAESLKSKASKIPDNDFGDWAIDLLLKPLWWFIVDIGIAASKDGVDGIRGMSRVQAMRNFDAIIKQIKREME